MNVLVLLPLSDSQRSKLKAALPEVTFTYTTRAKVTSVELARADAILGNLEPERVHEARGLRLLQLNSAGYDNYLACETIPDQVTIASASGAYGQAVSEHIFAMLFALMKRLPAYHTDQLSHTWDDHGGVGTFVGARVLVLGTGDIGGHFAELARACGAHVVGARRHPGAPTGAFEAIYTMDELEGPLAEADVVASFLPSTASTRGLADARFFAAMKPGALFANGGRGDLVVADDLIAALTSGHLAGAALDVTAPEPLPATSPLWDAPNILITPHVSGGFHLPAVLDNIVDIAIENLRRLEAGETPRNLVPRAAR